MTSNEVIKAVADIVFQEFDGLSGTRFAERLYNEGLLADTLPPPVEQVRRNPEGWIVAVRFDEFTNPWHCSDGVRRGDADVRDWPILVPEAELVSLRAERDELVARVAGFAARVAELEASEGCAVDMSPHPHPHIR